MSEDQEAIINVLKKSLERERVVIQSMQRSRVKIPFLYRKPWRASHKWSWRQGVSIAVNIHNLWSWLRYAHDCSDPKIGCSCSGGYRFPNR